MSENTPHNKSQRIAIVHDFLTSYGGAERVLQAISKLYPDAPVYTLLADSELTQKHLPGVRIKTSWLAKLPAFLRKRPRLLLLFFPAAIESFDLREYDLVISSSGAWSKGLVTRLHTKHIAYLHSPMRFAWDKHKSYLQDLGLALPFRIFGRFALSYLRVWDFQAADRPDVLLANSEFTKRRIAKYYRKPSTVVYPGIQIAEKSTEEKERTYFLVVSRLTKAKKVDVAIDAMNKLGLPLVVVGAGPERETLGRMAGKTITFKGHVTDIELQALYQGARALIIPSEEDFGLVAVEALAAGTPVIASARGGVREIVEDQTHGLFFNTFMPEILAEAILRFIQQEESFDRDTLRARASLFSEERFMTELKKAIEGFRED
ncbi:MAG: glycosyltransferase [Patescibacteria group bacterium]